MHTLGPPCQQSARRDTETWQMLPDVMDLRAYCSTVTYHIPRGGLVARTVPETRRLKDSGTKPVLESLNREHPVQMNMTLTRYLLSDKSLSEKWSVAPPHTDHVLRPQLMAATLNVHSMLSRLNQCLTWCY